MYCTTVNVKKFPTSTNFDLQSVSCEKLISTNRLGCNKTCAIFKDTCTLIFDFSKEGRKGRNFLGVENFYIYGMYNYVYYFNTNIIVSIILIDKPLIQYKQYVFDKYQITCTLHVLQLNYRNSWLLSACTYESKR